MGGSLVGGVLDARAYVEVGGVHGGAGERVEVGGGHCDGPGWWRRVAGGLGRAGAAFCRRWVRGRGTRVGSVWRGGRIGLRAGDRSGWERWGRGRGRCGRWRVRLPAAGAGVVGNGQWVGVEWVGRDVGCGGAGVAGACFVGALAVRSSAVARRWTGARGCGQAIRRGRRSAASASAARCMCSLPAVSTGAPWPGNNPVGANRDMRSKLPRRSRIEWSGVTGGEIRPRANTALASAAMIDAGAYTRASSSAASRAARRCDRRACG